MSRREDLKAVAGLALGWLALFLYIDPRGEFPLNDDFQYAESVRRWAAGGGFHLSQWGLSTSVTHLALGRLFSLFVEPTNWHLRLLMLGVGLGGVILFYFFLRGLGLERRESTAGAALLAANPLYLTMSASFHLDITATVLLIAAAWAFHARRLALCSLLVGLGFLTRQTALFALAGGALLLWRRRQLTLDHLYALLIPAAGAAAGFWLYLHSLPALPWAWQTQMPASAAPRSWLAAFGILSASLLCAGFFVIPLVFFQVRKSDAKEMGLARTMTFLAALLPILALCGGGLLDLGNTLSARGVGVVTLTAPEAKACGFWGVARLWTCLSFFASLSGTLVIPSLLRRAETPGRRQALESVLWFGLPPYLATLIFSLNFDRYLLALLPFLIAAILLSRRRPLELPYFAVLCAGLAIFSSMGLKDYFAWNRARTDAAAYAMRLGVKPEQIEAGFDWDGQYTLERNMETLLAQKPAKEIGMWDWMSLNKVVAIASFSKKPPKDNFGELKLFLYNSPLAPNGAAVYLYGDKRAFKRR